MTRHSCCHLLLLTQGYAIIQNPTIPIVGAGETANDTYVEQLVAGAQAAIDAAVALGVTDRDRDVTGGVYKARERIHRSVADLRLLATPTSWGRVADPNPN